MSLHIGKFKSTKQLTEENEQQGHLIEEKYEEGKGSQNRVNIPRKQILKLCVHLTLLGIPHKLRYEMTFEMETWSIRSRDYD